MSLDDDKLSPQKMCNMWQCEQAHDRIMLDFYLTYEECIMNRVTSKVHLLQSKEEYCCCLTCRESW